MHDQPLRGITVLDFGQVYNGPYCGFLLAQAGARVIKVESLVGETLRARGDSAPSVYPFTNLNTNKECITLNLKREEARELVRKLVCNVDQAELELLLRRLTEWADKGYDDASQLADDIVYVEYGIETV